MLELIALFNTISVAWVSLCNTRGLEKELQVVAGMMKREFPLNGFLCASRESCPANIGHTVIWIADEQFLV